MDRVFSEIKVFIIIVHSLSTFAKFFEKLTKFPNMHTCWFSKNFANLLNEWSLVTLVLALNIPITRYCKSHYKEPTRIPQTITVSRNFHFFLITITIFMANSHFFLITITIFMVNSYFFLITITIFMTNSHDFYMWLSFRFWLSLRFWIMVTIFVS